MAEEQIVDVIDQQLLEPRRIQGFDETALSAIFDSISHFRGHMQEIVHITRLQLGDAYQFEWVPTTKEEGALSSGVESVSP